MPFINDKRQAGPAHLNRRVALVTNGSTLVLSLAILKPQVTEAPCTLVSLPAAGLGK